MGHRREGRVVIIVMILSVLFGLAGRAGAAPQTLYVQPNAAKFRENPEFETDNVLAVILRGTPLKAFEPEGNWYPVQLLDGRTGWMHDSVLGSKPSGMSRPASASASRLPVVRIGMVQDGVSSGDDVAAVFEKEIRDLLEGEYAVRFPDAMRLQADWTMAGVKAAMDRLLASRQVDMILALGVFASHDTARRRLTKPVFAPFVINPQLQEISLKDGASGVRYLSYVTFPSNIVRDLRAFLEIVRFNKFAFLVAEGITESLPQLPKSVQRSVQDLGLEVTIVPVGTTVNSALAALTDEIEAVYVAPLQQLAPGEFQRLVEGLIARRLPSFSFWGRSEVERGLLFSLARDTNISRLARRVALNVQRTLLGEAPGTFPVTFSRGERMTFNMATARAMQLSPPWEFLTQMDVLYGEAAELPREVSLAQVVREAVQANLDVQAVGRFVAAGKETIDEARGELLPQVTAVAQGRVIDDDRANIAAPERTATGSLELLQLLYAEPTWANLSVQRSLQTSREQERQITLLDVVLDATTSYLNVLSAKTSEGIRRDNLNLTRTNLELAQVRRSVGVARPNEVLRWESQIANDRRDVINAFAQRQQAEIGLNRVLHRPLEERFATQEPSLDDPQLLTNFARILPYVDNPRYFAIFREFMVQEGLETAPELQQAAAEIAAQERVLLSAKRSFYTPTVSLQGNVSGIERDGVGRENNPDDHLNWQVGVEASLPLYTGGSRVARRNRAREELAQLQLQREAAAERIAASIRTTMYAAGSSYANIELAQEAAAAARENLALVTDAYGRGAVSILDLLDAQREALSANLDAANTVYVYLINLMQMQRAVGRFDFFVSASGRKAWFERLDAFFRANGVPVEERR